MSLGLHAIRYKVAPALSICHNVARCENSSPMTIGGSGTQLLRQRWAKHSRVRFLRVLLGDRGRWHLHPEAYGWLCACGSLVGT